MLFCAPQRQRGAHPVHRDPSQREQPAASDRSSRRSSDWRESPDAPADWTPPESPAITLSGADLNSMSSNERIKHASRGLVFAVDAKGNATPFAREIEALTSGEAPTIGSVAKELSKFFGTYKQQARGERGRKTDRFMFMVRIKCPAGGELNASQWGALDDAADTHADGTLRVTSRQAIQFHWVDGTQLAPLIRGLNRRYRRDATLGACGDVNRNVMTSPLDGLDDWNPRAGELAAAIAEALSPRSSSYFQIFGVDGDGVPAAPLHQDEPIYGSQYLPRKFKIGLAHARDNSIDLRTQDIGLLPVVTAEGCDGQWWDLYSGGGLGQSHNNPQTAALLGLYLGRVRRDQVVATTRAIAILQRENGERKNRRLARWKYTLRRLGLGEVKRLLRERFEIELEDAIPQTLPEAQLLLGWSEAADGSWSYGISIDSGRIHKPLRVALREAVETQDLRVRLTPHQDVLLCGVRDRGALETILDRYQVERPEARSAARRWAMACPAKPTCGLAMTEAERALPKYIEAIEAAGLGHVEAEIRITGCPNGCARPPSAEIGIFGYGKNDHVVLVGGSRTGSRIGKALYRRLPGGSLIPVLVGLFRSLDQREDKSLSAGDWLWQADPEALRERIGITDGSERGAAA